MKDASSPVNLFIQALWAARESAYGRIDAEAVSRWGRSMAHAVHEEVRCNDDYSPEEDGRVLWAREVLAEAGRRERVCRACGELEAVVEFLLGLGGVREPCGKDRAAGEDGR